MRLGSVGSQIELWGPASDLAVSDRDESSLASAQERHRRKRCCPPNERPLARPTIAAAGAMRFEQVVAPPAIDLGGREVLRAV
jgi:hypothetical protein